MNKSKLCCVAFNIVPSSGTRSNFNAYIPERSKVSVGSRRKVGSCTRKKNENGPFSDPTFCK